MIDLKNRQREVQIALNDRIELCQLKLSEEEDETGAKIDKDISLKKLWANVSIKRGIEQTENGRKVPYQFYKIIVRFDKLIEESMYFKYKGRILDIQTICDKDNRGLYLDIECMERVIPSG